MKKDVAGLDVINVMDVIERERRNLRRASAVLASLTVACMYEDEKIEASDVAFVARQLIDGAMDALDRVKLERVAKIGKQPP